MPTTLTQLTGGYSLAASTRTANSASGDNTDVLVVPQNKFYILLSLRVTHADTAARICEFFIDDGATPTPNLFCSPTVNGDTRKSVAASPDGLAWDGKLYLPEGWRVGVRIYAMTANKVISWQVSAIDCGVGSVIL